MRKLHYYAKFIVEAATPIAIGSGLTSDLYTDRPIIRDYNNLPILPSSSLAGVIRHSLTDRIDIDILNNLLGASGGDSEGSRVIISSAVVVSKHHRAIEQIDPSVDQDPYLSKLQHILVRQHTALNDMGSTKKGAKFDEEIVHKGTRWAFEMELLGDHNDQENWDLIVSTLQFSNFRVGSKTHSGYGKLRVVELKQASLHVDNDRRRFLDKSSSLNDPFWDTIPTTTSNQITNDCHRYQLELRARSFFHFGTGFGTTLSDAGYSQEHIVSWTAQSEPTIETSCYILIPATSIKGAIAHRTVFHYNRLKNFYNICDNRAQYTDQSPIRKELFGYIDNDIQQKGRVVIDDIYLTPQNAPHIFNHVSIDGFTAGAIDGALFNEETVYYQAPITIYVTLLASKKETEDETLYKQSLQNALSDIATGLLPLGGKTTKGHGIFTGKVTQINK